MELAKGNITENMPRRLSLSERECGRIIYMTDKIYYLEQETEGIKKIIDILMSYREKDSLSDSEKLEALQRYEQLMNNPLYFRLIHKNLEYDEYLKENMNKNTSTLDKKIVYLENRNERNRIRIKQFTCEFLETIYSEYFKKTVEKLQEMDNIDASYQEMKTLEELYKILSKIIKMDKIYDENEIYSNSAVQKYVNSGYKEIFTKYMKSTFKSREKQKSFRNRLRQSISSLKPNSSKMEKDSLDIEAEFGEYYDD